MLTRIVLYARPMKNNENTALLARKWRIDAERKAAAIAKREANNRAAMRKVAASTKESE